MLERMTKEERREIVSRFALVKLAGPAVNWRNESNPDKIIYNLAEMLPEEVVGCDVDIRDLETLLSLKLGGEGDEMYDIACNRAEVLVCRYWSQLCALAERLTAVERLEGDALAALLSETLGEMPKRYTRSLETLDHKLLLDGAEVEAWWIRDTVDEWSLKASIDGIPLTLNLELRYGKNEALSDESEVPHDVSTKFSAQPAKQLSNERPQAMSWDCVDYDWEEVRTTPLPCSSPLFAFLTDLIDAKLEEMRQDPDYLVSSEDAPNDS
jgi:hypothetical protein